MNDQILLGSATKWSLRARFVGHLRAKVEQRNVCICVKCVRVEELVWMICRGKTRQSLRGGHRASATKLVTKTVEAIANVSTVCGMVETKPRHAERQSENDKRA